MKTRSTATPSRALPLHGLRTALLAGLWGCALLSGGTAAGKDTQVPDDGVTSPTHQQFIGKIVWSNEKIVKAKEVPATFQTRLKTSDFIYGRAYLPHSAPNEPLCSKNTGRGGKPCQSSCTVTYNLYVDGVKQGWRVDDLKLSDAARKWTTFQVWLRPRPEDDPTHPAWQDIVNKLSPGEHTIKIELIATEGVFESKPMAVGQFTLVKDSDKPLAIGKSFDSFPAGLKDPQLEQLLLKTIQENAAQEKWKERFTKLKIRSKSWTTIRHEVSGVITGRQISAYAFAEWPDGHCTVQEFTFAQDYDGSQYVPESTSRYGTGEQERVDCTP